MQRLPAPQSANPNLTETDQSGAPDFMLLVNGKYRFLAEGRFQSASIEIL
jgi:hypothetical protein